MYVVTALVHYNNILAPHSTAWDALTIAYFHYFLLPSMSAMVNNNVRGVSIQDFESIGNF